MKSSFGNHILCLLGLYMFVDKIYKNWIKSLYPIIRNYWLRYRQLYALFTPLIKPGYSRPQWQFYRSLLVRTNFIAYIFIPSGENQHCVREYDLENICSHCTITLHLILDIESARLCCLRSFSSLWGMISYNLLHYSPTYIYLICSLHNLKLLLYLKVVHVSLSEIQSNLGFGKALNCTIPEGFPWYSLHINNYIIFLSNITRILALGIETPHYYSLYKSITSQVPNDSRLEW